MNLNKTLVDIELTGICGDLDKGSNCTNPIAPSHTYLEIYDILFTPYKQPDINILEIGFQYGCSIRLWKEYFSKNSNIFGIDICDNCSVKKAYENIKTNAFPIPIHPKGIYVDEDLSNIYLNKVDSHQPKVFTDGLDESNIKFDIIIDDGWHSPTSNITNFQNFIPYLKKDGLYIIEDMNIDGSPQIVIKALNDLGYELHIIDMSHPIRPDNILGIYYHKDNKHKYVFDTFINSKVWEVEEKFSVEYSIKKQHENINKGILGWNPHEHPTNKTNDSIYPRTANKSEFL
jgi:hypothetical protein